MTLSESKLVIGVPTVRRPRDYLLDTIGSLAADIPRWAGDRVEIVVFNADVVPDRHAHFRSLAARYEALVHAGGLRLITPPAPEKPFTAHAVALERRRTLGDEYWLWEAKLVLDAARLMELCRDRGDYYLHLEDDVIAVDRFYERLTDWFDNTFAQRRDWAALCLAPPSGLDDGAALPLHMLNSTAALMFRTADLNRFITFFRGMHGQAPLDRALAQWLEAHDKTVRVSAPALIQHIGRLSSRAGVFRDHESPTFPESSFGRRQRHIRELRDVLMTSPRLICRLLRMRRVLPESAWAFLLRMRDAFRRS